MPLTHQAKTTTQLNEKQDEWLSPASHKIRLARAYLTAVDSYYSESKILSPKMGKTWWNYIFCSKILCYTFFLQNWSLWGEVNFKGTRGSVVEWTFPLPSVPYIIIRMTWYGPPSQFQNENA